MNITIYDMLTEYFYMLEDTINMFEDDLFEKTFGCDSIDLIDNMEESSIPGFYVDEDEREFTDAQLLLITANIIAMIQPAEKLLEKKRIEKSKAEGCEFRKEQDALYASWPKEKQEAWAKWQAANKKNFSNKQG